MTDLIERECALLPTMQRLFFVNGKAHLCISRFDLKNRVGPASRSKEVEASRVLNVSVKNTAPRIKISPVDRSRSVGSYGQFQLEFN